MQNNKKYDIVFLDWDTKKFGKKSANIYLYEKIDIKDINDIKDNIIKENYEFVTIQNCGNSVENNIAISHFPGAFLADVNVQFIKNLKDVSKSENNEKIEIENNFNYDKSLVDIVKNAFKDSRFIVDTKLSNGDEVYTEWVVNAFNQSDKYFCYHKAGQIDGFILFSINDEEKSVFLELIAINENTKGKGIGTKLIRVLENFAIENKIYTINVGTQLNNIQAQNFYEKNGYKHITNNSIYHWFSS